MSNSNILRIIKIFCIVENPKYYIHKYMRNPEFPLSSLCLIARCNILDK